MKTIDYDAILSLLTRYWMDQSLDGPSHKNCWRLARIIEENLQGINYAELKSRPDNFRASLIQLMEALAKTDVEALQLMRNLTGAPERPDYAEPVSQQVNISGNHNQITQAGRDIVNLHDSRRGSYQSEEPPQRRPVAGNRSDMNPTNFQVFLCHASEDKPAVRELFRRLKSDGFSPWLDEEMIYPGDDWDLEIRRAIKRSNVVIVCLSEKSVDKRGYVNKEIKMSLDVADEMPEGKAFVIPLKLEGCEIPDRLSKWHWEYFDERGYGKLVEQLRKIAAAAR
jgi:TIR domain